ncbi:MULTISPECIES: adenine deaminase C-terminal domain-containing protein [unclassified Paenibacillus]|uniref:adenine deaminase C-terminal domain-containing protein n=1 Tax=unclassified Paenibacillus TaxID=185978 RepID=UPI001AE9F97D|nr:MULTISPECIES: adenine deaminase C-terminal domain-containing protein [unclassified Paenibacillus]MBP1156998.1 adenine deaminase [Paenibacillus sp. PvP091]MBP1172263.1 adenine deaminase [Paenibacillus sp. PvR098]MBP2438644.1 adenine deaminase [Paenibacillus sp. PvP052]
MKSHARRVELIEVAQGRRPADLFIKGGTVINVYSGEFLPQHVAIYKDRIAYIGNSEAAIGEHTKVIHAQGKYVSPGFIEPHAHPWVVYNPISHMMKSLSLGTTTIVNDNLFFYLYMGARGFRAMLQDLRDLPGNSLWVVRLVSQAEYAEERKEFNSKDIRSLLDLEEVVGTAEVTRWPLLYKGDPFVIDSIEYAKRLGKISDGHTAGCSYEKLNSIVAAGISSCHEAITAEEALDRLRLGMWTTLRNSSLRPDFPEIMKLVTEHKVSTNRILLTTDGPHPAFIEEQGSVDGLLRSAVELGLAPMQALQMATINPATFLGLDQELGGIAPARRADVLILPNLVDFRPELVISAGRVVASEGQLLVSPPVIDWMKYVDKPAFSIERSFLQQPDLYRYPHTSSEEPVPVIYFQSNVITKKKDTELPVVNGYADLSGQSGLVMANLIDREGRWVTKGIMERFAVELDGMASTYNTTTQLLVIGRDAEAMAKAAARVHEMGGGIVIVDRGEIIVEIPLPLAGMMTTDPEFHKAVEYQELLLSELKRRGFPFHDILYTLLFLTCDFLPGLRLIPLGLYDVKAGGVIKPAAALATERV